MSNSATLPDYLLVLNFPATMEVWDRRTGKFVHGVYKGGLVVGPEVLENPSAESPADLWVRLCKETNKILCQKTVTQNT
jgi:hypothetical protein